MAPDSRDPDRADPTRQGGRPWVFVIALGGAIAVLLLMVLVFNLSR